MTDIYFPEHDVLFPGGSKDRISTIPKQQSAAPARQFLEAILNIAF